MDYMKELNVAITVCDKEGKILQMNDKSQKTNHGDLVGQNVLDCHPEPARRKLMRLMEEHATNAYTIEKNGVKKLIYQKYQSAICCKVQRRNMVIGQL